MKPEVRESIGVGDRTEDNVVIVKNRKGWWSVPWRIPLPWWFTVYNGEQGKWLQIWKIAEVHESSK